MAVPFISVRRTTTANMSYHTEATCTVSCWKKKNDVCYIMYYHQFWGVDLLSEVEGGGACGSLNICHYVINIALKVYVHILRKAFFLLPHMHK